jgi:UPF0755 protein
VVSAVTEVIEVTAVRLRKNLNFLRRQMFKKIIKILLILIFLAVVIAGGAYYWYEGRLNFRAATDEKFTFQVNPGEGIDAIITKLIDKGFVSEKYIWQIFLKINPALGMNIQAGEFNLNTNMSIPDIFQVLQKANIEKGVKITIQEGLRYDEIADILEKGFTGSNKNAFLRSEFIKIVEDPGIAGFNDEVTAFLAKNKPAGVNLEGYLFPETYFFDEGTNAQTVVEKLITTLKQKISAEDYVVMYSSAYSFHQYLTIASLIERETLSVAEKPMVADIIYKRLEKGVDGVKLLQLDATLLYIIKDWKSDYKINEAFKDKYKTNPYNTYRVTGLPPTPICNAGLVAIKAAIYPQKNDYYYYIHDSSGVIHYGRNLSEHNANVKKYL